MLGAMAILGVASAVLRWGFHDAESVAQPVLAVLFALPLIAVSVLYLIGRPLVYAATAVALWSAVALMVVAMVSALLLLSGVLIAILSSS
jgi:hypothetical protein